MDIHKNARLTVHGRERIVRQVMSGQTPQAVALAAGVCPRTIRKWLPIAEMAVDHARLKAPHQPSRPHWEQPIEAPQLATALRISSISASTPGPRRSRMTRGRSPNQ